MRALALLLLVLAAPARAQGSVLIVGGGTLPPDALAWFVAHAPDRQVLVLDYSDTPSPRTRAALEAAGATVTVLAVTSAQAADDPRVLARVKAARAVFLPGGDQWRYVAQWRGRALVAALRGVVARGGVVGGTSAGAMVLGEVVYDARAGGASAREVLADPAGPGAALTVGFLDLLPGTLVDTHVAERARTGRLAALLARHHAEHGAWPTGVGLDDGTALAIGSDGVGQVYGSGVVVLLTAADTSAARVASGAPLSAGPFALAQVAAGGRVDVRRRRAAPDRPAAFAAAPLVAPAGRRMLLGTAALDTGGVAAALSAFLADAPPGALCLLTDGADGAALGRRLGRGRKVTLLRGAEAADCGAIAVAGADLGRLADALAAGTALGDAVRAHLAGGAPALFVGEAAALAGRAVLRGAADTLRAAADGRLTLAPGLDLAGGLVVVPESDAAPGAPLENRAAGLAWALAMSRAPAGVLLPDTGALLLDADGLHVLLGEAPTQVLDLRQARWAGTPLVRQNGTFEAILTVLAPGDAWAFAEAGADAAEAAETEAGAVEPGAEPVGPAAAPRRRVGW